MRLFYQYCRGIFGEISVLSLAFLINFLFGWFLQFDLIPMADQTALFYGIAVSGLFLYPTALGLSKLDIYRLGYQPIALRILLLASILLLLLFGMPVAAIILFLAVIGYQMNLFESNNLWDCLIDPFMTVYAVVCITCFS